MKYIKKFENDDYRERDEREAHQEELDQRYDEATHETILDIIDRHYDRSEFEYMGEFTLDDYLHYLRDERVTKLENDLTGDLEYISRHINWDWVYDVVCDETQGMLIQIGHWIFQYKGSESLDRVVTQLDYHDEDKELLDYMPTNTH